MGTLRATLLSSVSILAYPFGWYSVTYHTLFCQLFSSMSRKRSASSAAMQPAPAEVTA